MLFHLHTLSPQRVPPPRSSLGIFVILICVQFTTANTFLAFLLTRLWTYPSLLFALPSLPAPRLLRAGSFLRRLVPRTAAYRAARARAANST